MAGEDRRRVISETVDRIRDRAANQDLFSLEDFPPPATDSKRRSCLYRLSEDDDHGFALYLNVASGDVSAPPHDHTTWAVIVGIEGQEENRFYNEAPEGVEQIDSKMVEPGTGEFHTIHINAGKPVMNFHMYGRGLEQLHERKFWNERKREWNIFPAHTDIREARH